MTRYELLTLQPANFRYIHTFGQEVMILDPLKKNKLKDRGNLGIFLGIDAESNTYKIWSIKEKRIVRSRDVKFYAEKELSLEENETSYTLKMRRQVILKSKYLLLLSILLTIIYLILIFLLIQLNSLLLIMICVRKRSRVTVKKRSLLTHLLTIINHRHLLGYRFLLKNKTLGNRL